MLNRYIKQYLAIFVLMVCMPAGLPVAEAGELCATVKIEIRQELTLERQGFEAVMRINNGLEGISIDDINVRVNFTDADSQPVLASSNTSSTNPDVKFFIRIDGEDTSDVNGIAFANDGEVTAGSVAPGSTGEMRWLIIPTVDAVDASPELFFVGAELSYTYGGKAETVIVTPDFITVKPLPALALEYFIPQDVFGDLPDTLFSEPVEPYTIAVRVSNNGAGEANSLSIESAQPRIVDNADELLIDFRLTESYVNDFPANKSLLLNFGDMPGGSVKIGRWVAETTLAGKFIDFDAGYSHADELGGRLTSLITGDIAPYFMLSDVRVNLPGRDSVNDILAYTADPDLGQLAVFESEATGVQPSNQPCVNCSSVAAITGSMVPAGTDGEYTLATLTPALSGDALGHLEVENTMPSNLTLHHVVRADGRQLVPENAWQSKKRPGTNWAVLDHYVNIFDYDIDASYTLYFVNVSSNPQPPNLGFINDWIVTEGEQVGFLVQASDPNGTVPALSLFDAQIFSSAGDQALNSLLPAGASFSDHGDGTGSFRWFTQLGQSGFYPLTAEASDGGLSNRQVFNIVVVPVGEDPEQYTDDDNDGFSEVQGDLDDDDPFNYPGSDDQCVPGNPSCGPLIAADGDISGDGLVNLSDLILAQRYLLNNVTLSDDQIARADLFPAMAPDGIFGLSDLQLLQAQVLASPMVVADANMNRLPDAWEIANNITDAYVDEDGDGLSNIAEFNLGTDPNNIDSDNDGESDAVEVQYGADPNDSQEVLVRIIAMPNLLAGVNYAYESPLNANLAGASYELMRGPVGMIIEDNTLRWLPQSWQVGEHEIILRASVPNAAPVPLIFSLSVLPSDGDINDDGRITLSDLVLMQRFLLGELPSTEQQIRADIYPPNLPDGILSVSDLILLQRNVLTEE